MVKLTLLKEEQIWGDNALYVMKKVGTEHKTTDLVAILGGIVTTDDVIVLSIDSELPIAWTASSDGSEDVRCVDYYGGKTWGLAQNRRPAIRLAISPDEASRITLEDIETNKYHVATGKYGEFPRTAADEQTSIQLEQRLRDKELPQTGKNYIFDTAKLDDEYMDCDLRRYPEYVYKGEKYIRVSGRPNNRKDWPFCFMSAEERSKLTWVKAKKPYWVKVEPIKWYIDPSGWLVSVECISAGLQFDKRRVYKGNLENTFMNGYLKRLSKEIEIVRINEQEQQKVPPSKVAKRPSVSKKKNDGRGRV